MSHGCVGQFIKIKMRVAPIAWMHFYIAINWSICLRHQKSHSNMRRAQERRGRQKRIEKSMRIYAVTIAMAEGLNMFIHKFHRQWMIASQRINFKFRMTYACEYLRLLIVLIRACARAYYPRYFVIDIATAHHNPIQINGMTKMSLCAQQFQNNLMNGATQSGHDHIKGVQRTVFLSLCILSPTDQQLKLNSHRELFEYSYFGGAKTHRVVTIFDFFFFRLSDSVLLRVS